jgi:hypothetical protein
VDGEAQHDLGVAPPALPPAILQKTQSPAGHAGHRAQAQQQRRILPAQPSDHLERRAGGRPRVRQAGRDQAAVGEAGLQPGAGLAVHDGDLVAAARQVVRGRDADDAGAED